MQMPKKKKSLPGRIVSRLRKGSLVFSVGWPPISYTYPLGKGDLHLPVGWGAIPLEKVFGLLRGFRGTVVHEYRYNLFLGSAEEDYARVQNLFGMLEDPAPGPEKGR